MNILVISAEYPPFSVGGIALHTHEVNKSLAKEGNVIWTLTFHGDRNVDSINTTVEDGINVIRIPRPSSTITESYEDKFLNQNEQMKIGIHYLMDHRFCNFNMVVLHGYFLGICGMYACEKMSIPFVYHAHTLLSDAQLHDNVKILETERELYSKATYVIAVSEFLKTEILKRYSIDTRRIKVITKGVELKKYDKYENKTNDTYFKILYTGRISREKGFETLLNAISLSIKKHKNILVFAVGLFSDEVYRKEIIAMIRDEGLQKNIVFLGFKEDDKVIREYKSSNISVVPSFAETFGKVAIESMAARVPVIVSNVGGLGPIVKDGATGLKFKCGDEEDLSNKINLLYEYPCLCKKLADNAYMEVVKKYQWKDIFKLTLDIYQKVCEV